MKNTKNIRKKIDVELRDLKYAEKATTQISYETPSKDNPFIAENISFFGYKHEDLMRSASYSEMLFLFLTKKLPTKRQSELLEKTLCAFINIGPRNNATRAAITSGNSRSFDTHVLPVSLMVLSGKFQGAGDIGLAIHFLKSNSSKPVLNIVEEYRAEPQCKDQNNTPPGYGHYYGGEDLITMTILKCLLEVKGDWHFLNWVKDLYEGFKSQEVDVYLLREGVFAAVCCDLGIPEQIGAAFYQFCSAPGLIAHGFEHAGKPTTVLPFVSDRNYEII